MDMNALNDRRTIAEIAIEHPTRYRTIDGVGIDCGRGDKLAVEEACRDLGLDP
jgi:hypothetical protein